jgi:uncharacterized protein DUF4177
MVTKWKYRIYLYDFQNGFDTRELETTLNELGEEGWELASVFCLDNKNGEQSDLPCHVIFRRPKQEEPQAPDSEFAPTG